MRRITNAFLGMTLAVLGSPAPSPAQEGAPERSAALINCWDETFAYTKFSLRRSGGGYHFQLASQDGALFAPLFPGLEPEWGDWAVHTAFTATQCEADPDAARFTCAASSVLQPVKLYDVRAGPDSSPHSLNAQTLRVSLVDVVETGGGGTRKILTIGAGVSIHVHLAGGETGASAIRTEQRVLELPLPHRGCQGGAPEGPQLKR